MEACLFYLSNTKIRMFSRFTKMIEAMENDDFNYYISSFKFFDDMYLLIYFWIDFGLWGEPMAWKLQTTRTQTFMSPIFKPLNFWTTTLSRICLQPITQPFWQNLTAKWQLRTREDKKVFKNLKFWLIRGKCLWILMFYLPESWKFTTV